MKVAEGCLKHCNIDIVQCCWSPDYNWYSLVDIPRAWLELQLVQWSVKMWVDLRGAGMTIKI
jgi:hypothetical protein